ncbi:hypothetical protein EW146_g5479 [Bondarzewia mesenterica]|uniref:Ion transport domain-containing protein n=1 Tax=Bondarzewia mesenterica TaxID=1095465 RepID=A0A4V3XET8_9AGAM|nr:hypothetical protein EW146_g5479 [Bondarzewia mesenterica]
MSSPIPLSSLPSARFLTEHSSPRDTDDVFPAFEQQQPRDEASQDIHPPWKRDLLALLEYPTSSTSAFLIHVSTTTLIVFSALVTILETVPAFHSISGSIWFGLETSLVALFTVEDLLAFFGIIDLLAILPYYVEIALQQDTSTLFRFSILRTFRLLRVFRPFRYNNTLLLTIEVMYLSFRRSQHALLALSFFVIMVLIVFSTLLYFIERGTWDDTLETFINSDGDPSQFASIPSAAWFVIVTITTVGYGEITPRSFLGRLITLPLLVFGLLLIALPSFVLGHEFSIVWNEMTHDEVIPSSPSLFPSLSPSLSRRRTRARPRPRLTTPSPPPRASPSHFQPHFQSQPQSQSRTQSHSHEGPTNHKLAQNQQALSEQLGLLRDAVEAQGEMLRVLLTRERESVVVGTSMAGEKRADRYSATSDHGGRCSTRERWFRSEDK